MNSTLKHYLINLVFNVTMLFSDPERLEIHIAGSLFEGSFKTTVKTPEDKVQQTVEN